MMSKTPQYHGFVKSAIQNVELTIASQGLSMAIGQQKHFDWRVMVSSIASTLANVGASRYDLGHPLYSEALATASSKVTTIGIDKMLDGDMNTEAMVASALGTVIGNQLAAGAKQYYADYQVKKRIEAEARRSQIPEIGQTLEQSKRQFIDSVLEHPHDHGGAMKKDYSSSSTKTPSTHQTKTRNKSEPPPQPHLAKERAREEGQMCYASNWNQENSSTPTQQRVSQTQGGFWSTAGDAASSLIDMVNPVTQAKTTWADANESVLAFRNGEILRGLASTAHTALDVLYFVPVGSVASTGVRLGAKGVSAVGSKLGFFGGKGIHGAEHSLAKSNRELDVSNHLKIKENINQTRQGINSGKNFQLYAAKEAQISGGYFIDEWTFQSLQKGTIVFGGVPGQSSFFASSEALNMISTGKDSYWQYLQVKPHQVFGYRPRVGEFVLKQDMVVPTAKVVANPHLGSGGAQQFVINNFNSRLELIKEYKFSEILRNEMQSNNYRP